MSRFRLSIVLASVALLLGLLLAAVALSDSRANAQEKSNPEEVVVFDSEKETRRASRPWTPERMRSAIPKGPVKRKGNRTNSSQSVPTRKSAGEAFLSPGTPPGEWSPQTQLRGNDALKALGLEERLSTSLVLSPYAYPPPYSRYENFDDYLKYPYRTVGKLFFSDGTFNFVCSASSIGNHAVWTAGHCVHSGGPSGSFFQDFMYIPGYKDGQPLVPVAVWDSWFTAVTVSGWGASSNLAFDHGGVVFNPTTVGGHKVSVVGTLGFGANLPDDQHWTQFGYPAAAPFNGGRMIICAASRSTSDTSFDPNPRPVAHGCDQTGGSSGGPWVLDFNQGTGGGSGGASGGGILNGNTSYIYVIPFEPEQMYSPYFGTGAINIFNFLIPCNPPPGGCP